MKFLVIGDIHAELSFLSRVLLQASGIGVDGIILVGDLGSDILATKDADLRDLRERYYRGSVEAVFALLDRTELPVYYVAGNRDLPEISNGKDNFHKIDVLSGGHHVEVNGYYLLGIGGSNYDAEEALRPDKPKWFYEWTETQAHEAAMDYINEQGADIKLDRLIFVPHDPPWHTTIDRGQHGGPLGSQTIRELATSWDPCALLCGHVHESSGVDLLGRRTLAINAGSIVLPHVTYTAFELPRFTDVSVVYSEHFFILDFDSRYSSPRAEHHVYLRGLDQEQLIRDVYAVQDGKLFLETDHGSRPFPCTGNASAPNKTEMFDRMRRLQGQKKLDHLARQREENSSIPDNLIL